MFSLKSFKFASPFLKLHPIKSASSTSWSSVTTRVNLGTNALARRGIATSTKSTFKTPLFNKNSKYVLLLGIPAAYVGVAMCEREAIPIRVQSYEIAKDAAGGIVVKETPNGVEIQDRLGRISFGLLLGFVAGYAAKKIGKVVLFAAGAFFLVVQYLAYRGFLTVNWTAVATRATPVTDPAKRQRALQNIVSILTHNLLIKTGFFSGLAIGFKFG